MSLILRAQCRNLSPAFKHRPQAFTITRRTAASAQVCPRAKSRTSRYAGIAFFAAFACAASAYLFLPSAPSRAAPTSASAPLSAQHFTPSIVIASEHAGPDTKLITLRVNPSLVPQNLVRRSTSKVTKDDTPVDDGYARIYSVFVKDSDIQVERPYTPLECADEEGNMRFWVKKYENGEVGRWLHARIPGEVVELRGPVTTWDWTWRNDAWDEVVMISGGTGITPFYQYLHSIFADPTKLKNSLQTRYTLLHSSKTLADLPPPSILKPLVTFAAEHPDIFKLCLLVDSAPGGSAITTNIPLSPQIGRIGKAEIENSLGLNRARQRWWDRLYRQGKEEQARKKRILFLVCGPELMINAIAGPYGRNFSQGLVGGVLGDMEYTSKEVWKL
ncbi:hypothetical protein AX17_001159 [Amanita inopinata Kibby_2008]|nr:hypothetical protein AX17_001159 [Amanita inopinata Kibby_2008]